MLCSLACPALSAGRVSLVSVTLSSMSNRCRRAHFIRSAQKPFGGPGRPAARTACAVGGSARSRGGSGGEDQPPTVASAPAAKDRAAIRFALRT